MKRAIPLILILASCSRSQETPREPGPPSERIQVISHGERVNLQAELVPGRVMLFEFYSDT